MRLGYSILLGETIDADSLSYRDCEPFQIVCPACYEPLFKVSRKSGDNDEPIEYLSHYKQDQSYDADCEHRVASTPAAERQRHNAQSRDQKLSYFLSVFRLTLERDPYFAYKKGITHAHKQMDRSKVWCLLREQHFKSGRRGGMADHAQFQEAAKFYLEEIAELGGVPKTAFSMSTQIRIAADMMKLLTSDPGKPNYKALYNHAAVYLLQRCQNPASTDSVEVLSNLTYFISGLLRAGKKSGLRLVSEMNATPIYPPYVETPATYLLKFASEIGHEMIGTLLRLPYFEILKDAQSNDAKRV